MIPFWCQVKEASLRHGHLMQGCLVPVFDPDFGTTEGVDEVPVAKADLIVVTQSCDLENAKIPLVALCRIESVSDFVQTNFSNKEKERLDRIRKGRHEGLHLLASPTNPGSNREALIVDFRQIFSLPFDYLTTLAEELGDRWRLDSPFLEHFSQAFARFFMRVGLPSAIPSFK